LLLAIKARMIPKLLMFFIEIGIQIEIEFDN